MKLKELIALMPAMDRICVHLAPRRGFSFEGYVCDLRATLDEETKNKLLESFVIEINQSYDHSPYIFITVTK